MCKFSSALTAIVGVTFLFFSFESNAGKPVDGGTGGPQDVNVVNTPTVLSVEALKSISTEWVIPAFEMPVKRLDYTPPTGMRVVLKSLLMRSGWTTSEIFYTGGYQGFGPTGEVTIALPEGPFSLVVQFGNAAAVERRIPVLLTFYEVPVN